MRLLGDLLPAAFVFSGSFFFDTDLSSRHFRLCGLKWCLPVACFFPAFFRLIRHFPDFGGKFICEAFLGIKPCADCRAALRQLTPARYTGLAAELARRYAVTEKAD